MQQAVLRLEASWEYVGSSVEVWYSVNSFLLIKLFIMVCYCFVYLNSMLLQQQPEVQGGIDET